MSDRFDEFYERHKDPVLRAVFVASGDLHAAQEAVDEAFARACQYWARLERHPSKVAWVTRTALNELRSSWRRRRRSVLGTVPDGRVLPEEPMDPALFDAVLALPERQRQVVGLRLLLDLSVEDTATVLDIASGTVTAHLSRAVASLRRTLMEEATVDGR